MTTQTPWTEALDDFERTLARAVAALDEANRRDDPGSHDGTTDAPVVVEPFVPPVIAEPFPPELLDRANGLLGRAARLTSQIQVAQVGIRQELARLPRSRRPEPAAESRFEARA